MSDKKVIGFLLVGMVIAWVALAYGCVEYNEHDLRVEVEERHGLEFWVQGRCHFVPAVAEKLALAADKLVEIDSEAIIMITNCYESTGRGIDVALYHRQPRPDGTGEMVAKVECTGAKSENDPVCQRFVAIMKSVGWSHNSKNPAHYYLPE